MGILKGKKVFAINSQETVILFERKCDGIQWLKDIGYKKYDGIQWLKDIGYKKYKSFWIHHDEEKDACSENGYWTSWETIL